jgi:hypothetical protein
MKKYLLPVLSGMLFVGTALAHDEPAPLTFQPVETFSCNFNDGKGPEDLASAVAFWNEHQDSQNTTSYMAMTITPNFYGPETGGFDIGWLGVWPTGAAMGAGYDSWFSTGGEAATRMFEVLSCDSHAAYASLNIKPPSSDVPPDNLVITFSNCNVADDVSWDSVIGGMKSWAAFQAEAGYKNATWMLFPAYGGGGEVADFKLVQSYESYSDLGTDFDLIGNGEGFLKRREILGDMLDCDASRVYNADVVRRWADAD